ncbi:MAG TPA: MMPL family transporter [Nocardioidaceae bacterium]|nr:MMPL family transporter [Nocardioidaceae bacterium]
MTRKFAGAVCGRRIKWAVLAFWIILTAVLGAFGAKLADVEDNETVNWLPGSAESTQALEEISAFRSDTTLDAVMVYERDGGITPEDVTAARADITEFEAMDGKTVGEVVGDDSVAEADTKINIDGQVTFIPPEDSTDGAAMQVVVPIDAGKDGWLIMPDLADHMRSVAEADANGMTTHLAGYAGLAADQADAFASIDGVLLLAALGVVIIILLFTYRSPFLWLFPVICVVFALFSAQGLIYLLAKYADLTVNAQTRSILSVLVLGAGTDYALLLVARYREELRRHHDRHEAMEEALHRAGPAIIASSSTVIIGMLCLIVAEMNSTQSMGPVLAIGVGVVLLAMISLLPALLVIMGRWIFWPVKPVEGSHEPTSTGFWANTGWKISHRPRAVWVGTSVALAIMAIGTITLDAKGLDNSEQFVGTPDSVKGERVIEDHFSSAGDNNLQIVANADTADQVVKEVSGVDGVNSDAVTVAGEQDGTALILAGIEDGAFSEAAFATVERVRDTVHGIDGADALVGGNAAVNWDVQEAAGHDNKVVIPLVLVMVFLILLGLLRAVVAPVLLIGTVVLSFGAALGFSAVMFEYVFDISGADSGLPLFAFVFLVALGIDYNIFLMTRVREEANREGSRRGALIGLAATGGVITSAGLVLAGTFGTLATVPLTFTLQIGFVVAFGVLLDTIIVRSILVTGLNLDLGRHMWWPSRLGKREHDEQFEEPDESQELETVHAPG